MKQVDPLLIAPECSAPGCHHNGDVFMMVKCHSCGHWFCEEHIETAQGGRSRSQRATNIANAPTVKRIKTGLSDLTFFLGSCAACREEHAKRRPVDSSWLR
jgi:hypothetical protein